MTDLDLPVIRKLSEALPLTELHDQIIVPTALLYNAKVLTKNGPIQDSRLVDEEVATGEPATVLTCLHKEALRQAQRAVEPLSLAGVLEQLSPHVRQEVLTTCVTAADVQLRIDQTVYVTRDMMPVKTRVCVVPGSRTRRS